MMVGKGKVFTSKDYNSVMKGMGIVRNPADALVENRMIRTDGYNVRLSDVKYEKSVGDKKLVTCIDDTNCSTDGGVSCEIGKEKVCEFNGKKYRYTTIGDYDLFIDNLDEEIIYDDYPDAYKNITMKVGDNPLGITRARCDDTTLSIINDNYGKLYVYNPMPCGVYDNPFFTSPHYPGMDISRYSVDIDIAHIPGVYENQITQGFMPLQGVTKTLLKHKPVGWEIPMTTRLDAKGAYFNNCYHAALKEILKRVDNPDFDQSKFVNGKCFATKSMQKSLFTWVSDNGVNRPGTDIFNLGILPLGYERLNASETSSTQLVGERWCIATNSGFCSAQITSLINAYLDWSRPLQEHQGIDTVTISFASLGRSLTTNGGVRLRYVRHRNWNKPCYEKTANEIKVSDYYFGESKYDKYDKILLELGCEDDNYIYGHKWGGTIILHWEYADLTKDNTVFEQVYQGGWKIWAGVKDGVAEMGVYDSTGKRVTYQQYTVGDTMVLRIFPTVHNNKSGFVLLSLQEWIFAHDGESNYNNWDDTAGLWRFLEFDITGKYDFSLSISGIEHSTSKSSVYRNSCVDFLNVVNQTETKPFIAGEGMNVKYYDHLYADDNFRYMKR